MEEKRFPCGKEQGDFFAAWMIGRLPDLMFMSMKKAITMNGMIHGEKTRVQHQEDQ